MNRSKECKLKQSSKHRWKGGKQIPCSNCGHLLWITPYYLKNKQYKNYYCDKKCEANGRVKNTKETVRKIGVQGGCIDNRHGYVYVKVDRKRYLLHRYLMQEKLKRELKKTEQVHHMNGKPWDNRIENLVLVDCKNHPAQSETKIKALQKRINYLEKELKKYVP